MIQKILSCCMIFVLAISTLSPAVFADSDYYESYLKENIADSAETLNTIKNGKKYEIQIDVFFQKNGKDAKLMNKLNQRLFKVEQAIAAGEGSRRDAAIIGYLAARLDLELYNIQLAQDAKRQEEAEKLVEEMFDSTLSSREKSKVDAAMIDLQNHIYNQGNSVVESIIGEFDKYAHREEIGNLEMSFEVNIQDEGSAKGEFNFKDYSAKTQLFNSQFTGHIDGMIQVLADGENISAEFESFMDFLSVEGNMYLLMENLDFEYSGDIEDEMGEFVPNLLEKIQSYAKDNVYIKIEDPETQALLSQLENLNLGNLGGEIQLALDEPMLEAYKKDGDMYLLKPTKHFCDAMKSIASRFDPFYGDECSEGQYNDLLVGMTETGGKLYMKTGTTNTLGYTLEDARGGIDMSIDFSKAYIKKTSINIEDSLDSMMFEYERNSHIDFNFSAGENGEDFEMDFAARLNNRGGIAQATGFMDIDQERIAEMSIKNGHFTASYDYTTQRYDWETEEYSDSYHLSAELLGKWDNGFETAEFNAQGHDLSDSSNSWNMELDYGIHSANAINGNIEVILENKPVFTVDMTGVTEPDYIDVENDIVIDMYALMGPYSPYNKINMDIEFMADTRDNKNNLDIEIHGNIDESSYFDFDLKNEGKILPFDGEIEAPDEYVELEDILGESIQY